MANGFLQKSDQLISSKMLLQGIETFIGHVSTIGKFYSSNINYIKCGLCNGVKVK